MVVVAVPLRLFLTDYLWQSATGFMQWIWVKVVRGQWFSAVWLGLWAKRGSAVVGDFIPVELLFRPLFKYILRVKVCLLSRWWRVRLEYKRMEVEMVSRVVVGLSVDCGGRGAFLCLTHLVRFIWSVTVNGRCHSLNQFVMSDLNSAVD